LNHQPSTVNHQPFSEQQTTNNEQRLPSTINHQLHFRTTNNEQRTTLIKFS